MDLVLDTPLQGDPAFAGQMAKARGLLRKPKAAKRVWPAMLAALAFASAGILFVSVIVIAPQAPHVLTKKSR